MSLKLVVYMNPVTNIIKKPRKCNSGIKRKKWGFTHAPKLSALLLSLILEAKKSSMRWMVQEKI